MYEEEVVISIVLCATMFNPQPGTIHRQGTLSHFAGYDFDFTVTRDEANKIMSESVSDTRDFEISSSSTFLQRILAIKCAPYYFYG